MTHPNTMTVSQMMNYVKNENEKCDWAAAVTEQLRYFVQIIVISYAAEGSAI